MYRRACLPRWLQSVNVRIAPSSLYDVAPDLPFRTEASDAAAHRQDGRYLRRFPHGADAHTLQPHAHRNEAQSCRAVIARHAL